MDDETDKTGHVDDETGHETGHVDDETGHETGHVDDETGRVDDDDETSLPLYDTADTADT